MKKNIKKNKKYFTLVEITLVELFVLDELSSSADFRFAVVERGKEFSSVVSREF